MNVIISNNESHLRGHRVSWTLPGLGVIWAMPGLKLALSSLLALITGQALNSIWQQAPPLIWEVMNLMSPPIDGMASDKQSQSSPGDYCHSHSLHLSVAFVLSISFGHLSITLKPPVCCICMQESVCYGVSISLLPLIWILAPTLSQIGLKALWYHSG